MEKNPFVTFDGRVVSSLEELYLTLNSMEDSVFNEHVNHEKNDFSSWLEYKGYPELASGIKPSTDKEHASRVVKTFLGSKIEEPEHKEKSLVGKDKLEKTFSENLPKKDYSKTGIKEFDGMLNGGIPRGSIVLLSGNAGTGKTTFAMQWLYNGANEFKEPGLYFALTEPITKTIKNIKSFNFYKDRSHLVHMTDLRSVFRLLNLQDKKITEKEIETLLNTIKSLAQKTKAKRIVIDSITALCYILEEKNLIRSFIFKLGNVLNDLKCTIFLTSEVSKEAYSVFGVEEFISDGIIMLKQSNDRDRVYRTIQIAKMRGITYKPEFHKFRITENGFKILAKVHPELNFATSKTFVTSGIKGMDKMLGGGYYKGSTTLISGAAGAGKSLMGIQFLYEGLKRKQPCLLLSFEESKEQILRNAENIGCNLKKYLDKGNLQMINVYPDKHHPEEHLLNIAEVIEKYNIKRCVLDSISALAIEFSQEELNDFFKKLNVYLKSKTVTTLFICATQMEGEHKIEYHTQSTTDNIVVLKYVEIDSEMRLMIGVIKTRGTRHDKQLREYVVSNKGIVLKDTFKNVQGLFIGGTSKKVDTDLLKSFEELAKGKNV